MKREHITPFIESVHRFFVAMLGCEAVNGGFTRRRDEQLTHGITSIIGLGGEATGSVALSFPWQTALNIACRLLHTDCADMNHQVIDAMAEVTNIIAGSAKTTFSKGTGRPIDLSLPNVIIGKEYMVSYPSVIDWLEVSFTSELGAFSMRVTFELNENGSLDEHEKEKR